MRNIGQEKNMGVLQESFFHLALVRGPAKLQDAPPLELGQHVSEVDR
jgi:hypothetical protein